MSETTNTTNTTIENGSIPEGWKKIGVSFRIYNEYDERIRIEGYTLFNEETSEIDLYELKNAIKENPFIYRKGYKAATLEDAIRGYTLANARPDKIKYDRLTGLYFTPDLLSIMYDGENGLTMLLKEYEGKLYAAYSFSDRKFRLDDGSIETKNTPEAWIYNNRFYFCDDCNCYVKQEDFRNSRCRWCEVEYRRRNPIYSYGESHCLEPVYFGSNNSGADFCGLGFELEIENENNSRSDHQAIARDLIQNCGFSENELRYAWDGSVDYGFETISQPHTVKDFWNKLPLWENMLKYFVNNGYSSHDGGRCGLHVHVSRTMFGKTEHEQDLAIAKVFTFFDENWDDLVKVSRRSYFGYCDRNTNWWSSSNSTKKKFEEWRKYSKGSGSHGTALNNGNKYTFEYRLGRGTLNSWSFFSWIDLVLTITKNAKRISINSVCSNDIVSWLAGLRESSAKYIYKRGAFRDAMLALYPSIAWETDLAERY